MIASQKGKLGEAMMCLEEDINYIDTQDIIGRTALVIAIQYNSAIPDQSDIIKLLIEKGASLDIQNDTGKTALMYSIMFDRIDIVTLLLEKGASLDNKDHHGRTAMMYAVFQRYVNHGETRCTSSPFHGDSHYEKFNDSHIIELLIEKGASLDIQDNEGKTALTISQEKGNEEIVEYIMKKKVLNAEARLVIAQAIKQSFEGLPYELGLYDQIQSHL